VGQYPDFAYDPLFTYYRWYHHSRDPEWQANLKGWHAYYRSHPEGRPPHNMAAQARLMGGGGTRPDRDFLSIGLPVDAIGHHPPGWIKVVGISAAQQARFEATALSTRRLETERSRLESKGAGGHGKGPHNLALPRVPQGMVAGHAGAGGGAKDVAQASVPADAMQPPKLDRPLEHNERTLQPPPHYNGGSGRSSGGSARGSEHGGHEHGK
jgi:hypothetical protein